MLRVVEFLSFDKSKRMAKEYEERLLMLQIPDWCDIVRIGSGRYFIPQDRKGYYGEYEITKLEKQIYVCEKIQISKNAGIKGLFRDGSVCEIDETFEIISPQQIIETKEYAQKNDENFFEEYPELPQFDY
ncbi:MAG: hypothetical protein J6Q13_04255 [Clostridia bacterium]|nr:hypothetical protein [Clostridia bacterium]